MSILNKATTAHATVNGLKSTYHKFLELKASLPKPEFDFIYSTQEAMDFLTANVPQESEHYGKPLSRICGIPFTVSSIPELDGGREAVQQRRKALVICVDAGQLKAWVIDGAALAGRFTQYVPKESSVNTN